MNNPVRFLASFPAIQSAIRIGQDGARIQLDIPETEMANAVELLAMRSKLLRVTIEIAPISSAVSTFEELLGAVDIPNIEL